MNAPRFLTNQALGARLGETLRLAREKAGWTQAEVAERVQLVPEVYGRVERGGMTPSVALLRSLCEVLAMDANVALGLDTPEGAAKLRVLVPEDSPRLRSLMRTLRQLNEPQLAAITGVVRLLVPGTDASEKG